MSMTTDQIVAALEAIRAGKSDAERVMDIENYLIDRLLEEGTDAVASLLMSLPGIRFSDVPFEEETPLRRLRSGHESNALIVELLAVEDIASISIDPEEPELPELPIGHQWFYEIWESMIGASEPPTENPQRTVYLIASFEADVMNGGLGQYLSNSDGQYVDETVKALQSIAARRTATFLHKAASLKKADESWDDLWNRASDELSKLDDQMMQQEDYLALLTAQYFDKDC